MSKSNKKQEIGDVMPDGTIYAGISPTTGEVLYVTQQDAPLQMTWKKATEYATGLDAHGHTDWRLPSLSELNVLFVNNRQSELKNTFNERGDDSDNACWYWSGTEHSDHSSLVYGVRFTDGLIHWHVKDGCKLSTRPVRAEPRP